MSFLSNERRASIGRFAPPKKDPSEVQLTLIFPHSREYYEFILNQSVSGEISKITHIREANKELDRLDRIKEISQRIKKTPKAISASKTRAIKNPRKNKYLSSFFSKYLYKLYKNPRIIGGVKMLLIAKIEIFIK